MKQNPNQLLDLVKRRGNLFRGGSRLDICAGLKPSLGAVLALGMLAACVCTLPVFGQSDSSPVSPEQSAKFTSVQKSPAVASAVDSSSYTIGPGDVLAISFSNSPELNHRVQVGQSGDISVPLLPTPIHAAGLTPLQLAEKVGKALENAKQLRNPYVSIYVEQHNSHFATVLGAVEHPGVYPLVRPTTLLELISMAGGLSASAGATLTVVHAADDQTTALPNSPSFRARAVAVQLSELKDNNDPSLNILVRSGDVVNVSSAPVVYVVGAVGKPGGFVLHDPQSGLTVLQALAMAEGLQSTAAGNHSLLIRRPYGAKERQLIPIDFGRLMKGKGEDQELRANDILVVPDSQAKKTLQALVRTAEASASTMAGYGLGVRIGGVR
jgi:polysaccharide biosynthesis/export protein